MESVSKVKDLLKDLSDNIDVLEAAMEPVLNKDLSEQIANLDDSLEEAKLYTLLAYSLQSILFAYLKTMGQDTSKHEIQKELERVKLYMSKVKSAEKTNTKPQNSPGFIVNKEVVHRLIKNSTGNGTSKIKSSTMTSQAVDNYLQTIKSEVEATEVAKIAKGDISDIQNESVIRDDQINSSKRSRESEDQTNIEPSAKRIVSDNSEVNNKKNNRAKKDKKKRQKKH